MDLQTFNRALLAGWLLLLIGGVVIHPGWGLAVAGAALIGLTFAVAWIGGIATPETGKPAGQQSAQRAAESA